MGATTGAVVGEYRGVPGGAGDFIFRGEGMFMDSCGDIARSVSLGWVLTDQMGGKNYV
jgi:hypothetical protein